MFPSTIPSVMLTLLNTANSINVDYCHTFIVGNVALVKLFTLTLWVAVNTMGMKFLFIREIRFKACIVPTGFECLSRLLDANSCSERNFLYV